MSRRSRRGADVPTDNRKKYALVGVLSVGLIVAIATMPESDPDDSFDLSPPSNVTAANPSPTKRVAAVGHAPAVKSVSASAKPVATKASPVISTAGNNVGGGHVVDLNAPTGQMGKAGRIRRRHLDEIASQRLIRMPADPKWSRHAVDAVRVEAVYQAGGQAEALVAGSIVRCGTVLGRDCQIGEISIDGVEVSSADR